MSQYIPDLTERFPEGFDGVDEYSEKTPADVFWENVKRAEKYEEDGKNYWISFATQDGVQRMMTLFIPDKYDTYDYIESHLLEKYGNDLAEIADYGTEEN